MKKSDTFILLAAAISLAASAYLWFTGQTQEALFTGIWVPSVLGFGIYVKLMAGQGKRS